MCHMKGTSSNTLKTHFPLQIAQFCSCWDETRMSLLVILLLVQIYNVHIISILSYCQYKNGPSV